METHPCKSETIISYQMTDDEIFTIKFSGFIPFEDIMVYLDDFNTIEGLPDSLCLLYDLTKTEIELDQNKLKIISDRAIEVTRKFASVKTAFVVSEPKVTAYTMLFSHMMPNENASRKIFSTMLAARDWLLHYR